VIQKPLFHPALNNRFHNHSLHGKTISVSPGLREIRRTVFLQVLIPAAEA
jgi:hypothetical protein